MLFGAELLAGQVAECEAQHERRQGVGAVLQQETLLMIRIKNCLTNLNIHVDNDKDQVLLYVILFTFYERSTLKTSCQSWKIRTTPFLEKTKTHCPFPCWNRRVLRNFPALFWFLLCFCFLSDKLSTICKEVDPALSSLNTLPL